MGDSQPRKKQVKNQPTFDSPEKTAAIGVLGDQIELGAGEHGFVRVDVVDGELDGETRRAANDRVVGEERAHGHRAGTPPLPRRRRHRAKHQAQNQQPFRPHCL